MLIVDDEPDIRQIAAIALERLGGFRVKTAASGAEALRLAGVEVPDALLIDVMMPDLDGPTTLQRLRALGVTAPAVFLTARVQRQEVLRWQECGAAEVVGKPFDPLKLPDVIRRCLA